jgi:branched-subunit amino acid ABC-type transport system permease component
MPCTGIPYCHEFLLLAIGLSNGAIIALNALGFTLIYAAIRTINLAYGDVFALASVAAASALAAYGEEGSGALATAAAIGLALVLAMLFGATLNTAVERLAFRPFRGRTRLAPLIASVGLSFVLYQAAFFWRARCAASRSPATAGASPRARRCTCSVTRCSRPQNGVTWPWCW